MDISFQSHEGHSTLLGLSDQEVDAKFAELTKQGYRGFASTRLDEPISVKTPEEARDMQAEEIFFIAPLQGG